MSSETPKTIPLIAIVGRPNVGKSTLFNRLTGKWQSIVEDRPGITRDRIYGDIDVNGQILRIVDTGGLNLKPESLVEQKMSEQAEKGIQEANLILFVMDGRAGVTAMDREWVNKLRKLKTPKLYLINKLDTPDLDEKAYEFSELGVKPVIAFSAEKQRNFTELSDSILKILNLEPISEKVVVEPEPWPEDLSEEAEITEGRWSKYLKRLQERPLNIAILGRPNVGKSTLLNALLGDERSIVDDVPGTTRDPIHSYMKWEDKEYCLIDTAGIRKRAKSKDRVEKFSIVSALNVMEKADLVLLVIDGQIGPTDQDAHVAGYAFEKNKAMIILVNKWDVGSVDNNRESIEHDIDFRMTFLNRTPVLYISAKTKKNLGKIFDLISTMQNQMDKHIKTSEVNKVFQHIVEHHPLPTFRSQNIRMFYATQVGVRPPTFSIFCTEPKHVHFSYKRYLINAFKSAFEIPDVPVRILFKKRERNLIE